MLRPETLNPTTQLFDGGRFYFNGKIGVGSYTDRVKGHSLRRKVWEANYGGIPPNHVVRNKDRNPHNNHPENLECISRTEQRRRMDEARQLSAKKKHKVYRSRKAMGRDPFTDPLARADLVLEAAEPICVDDIEPCRHGEWPLCMTCIEAKWG